MGIDLNVTVGHIHMAEVFNYWVLKLSFCFVQKAENIDTQNTFPTVRIVPHDYERSKSLWGSELD